MLNPNPNRSALVRVGHHLVHVGKMVYRCEGLCLCKEVPSPRARVVVSYAGYQDSRSTSKRWPDTFWRYLGIKHEWPLAVLIRVEDTHNWNVFNRRKQCVATEMSFELAVKVAVSEMDYVQRHTRAGEGE
jgi:hypothetical protein